MLNGMMFSIASTKRHKRNRNCCVTVGYNDAPRCNACLIRSFRSIPIWHTLVIFVVALQPNFLSSLHDLPCDIQYDASRSRQYSCSVSLCILSTQCLRKQTLLISQSLSSLLLSVSLQRIPLIYPVSDTMLFQSFISLTSTDQLYLVPASYSNNLNIGFHPTHHCTPYISNGAMYRVPSISYATFTEKPFRGFPYTF